MHYNIRTASKLWRQKPDSFKLIYYDYFSYSTWLIRSCWHINPHHFPLIVQQPPVGQGPPLSRLHDHTQTFHTRQDSSGRVISSTQRPLPDNTQHSQETDIHAAGGIPTSNPSKWSAADQSLRPRGHWDSSYYHSF